MSRWLPRSTFRWAPFAPVSIALARRRAGFGHSMNRRQLMDELELIRSFESDVEASSAAREAARARLLRARGEHMQLSANPRHARLRKRTTRVRWRVGIALAIVAVATVVPLTALGIVFGGTPTPHPRLQSGPIEISLSSSLGWTAASTSTRLRIAGAP